MPKLYGSNVSKMRNKMSGGRRKKKTALSSELEIGPVTRPAPMPARTSTMAMKSKLRGRGRGR